MNMHTSESSSGAQIPADGCGLLCPNLLLEVDFKWLMAGQGCWIDPERLRADPLYARNCLRTASHSPCAALRACARFLQETLEHQVAQSIAV